MQDSSKDEGVGRSRMGSWGLKEKIEQDGLRSN